MLTVIIANRGELPSNLARTVASIEAGGALPLVVADPEDTVMGCGYRRHEGILAAETSKVFLCDGHMEFDVGYFDAISAALDAHPGDLLCTQMQTVDHDWNPTGGAYSGARLNTPWSVNLNETVPFAGVWRESSDDTPKVVPCVMGACYAFRRESYDRWGRPLAILRAWGGDEEALSLAAWFAGDSVRLTSGVARHMYAAPRVGGRVLTDAEAIRIWANRDAILRAFPFPEAVRRRLRDTMYTSAAVKGRRKEVAIEATARTKDINYVKDSLVSTRDWAWLEAHVVNREDVGTSGASAAGPPAGKRGSTPRGVGKKRTAATNITSATTPAPPKRRPRANYGANENRRQCHICGSTASRINSVRQAGRMVMRYRTCSDCGRNRVTQEIITTV